MKQVDLILHPVRFRVLETLIGESRTTQDIAERLPDVPKSSIYRHLRALLEGGVIAVDETHPVGGALERTYRLNHSLRLSEEEMAGLTPEEHVHYFRAYVLTLVQGFSNYAHAAAVDDRLDMVAHRAGYSEAFVHATTAELDAFFKTLNKALHELTANRPAAGRRRQKIAIITHPENQG